MRKVQKVKNYIIKYFRPSLITKRSVESLKGLFPRTEAAATDPKCVVISEVMQEMTKNSDMSSVTQSTLQEHPARRYADLSQESRLSLPDADHKAFLLYQKGVASETAQKYYSFRLSEADAKKWSIVIV